MALDGKYDIIVRTPMGKQNYQLLFVTNGDGLSGQAFSPKVNRTENFTDGTVEGDNFQFIVKVKGPMGKMKLNFTGTLNGDKISGVVKTMLGNSPFEGIRI